MAAGRRLNPRLLRHDGSVIRLTRKASARYIATNKPWWVECEGVGTAAMRSGPEEQQQGFCFLASNGSLGLRALGSYDSLGYWMQQTTAADAGRPVGEVRRDQVLKQPKENKTTFHRDQSYCKGSQPSLSSGAIGNLSSANVVTKQARGLSFKLRKESAAPPPTAQWLIRHSLAAELQHDDDSERGERVIDWTALGFDCFDEGKRQ
ncbi:hypothetical protein V8E53_006701 [Lactarius tabidus]